MVGMTGQTASFQGDGQAVAAQIEERFVAGRPAGTKLPGERDLAQQVGVSRPILREALRSLAERGLIHVSPGRGAFTRVPGTADLARPLDSLFRRQQATPRQLVEARLMLECETATLAAERAVPGELRRMRAVLEQLDQASGPLEKAGFDITFHTLLARAAHNPVIEAMFASITPLTYELMVRSLADPMVSTEGAPLHYDLLQALEHRDQMKARAVMHQHLSLALERYGEDLDRSIDLVVRRELSKITGRPTSIDEFLGIVERLATAADQGGLPGGDT
jgi:GntR family transcriptional repressor for pyruvate dehydrogenase complex